MHKLLESYLSEVAGHLSALPVKQRSEELREMQTHLQNAFLVSRELGQSEDAAAQNIVAQFGTPQDLGENVVWAWRRERRLNTRSLWGAAICALVLVLFVPALVILLEQHYLGPSYWIHLPTKERLVWFLSNRFAGAILAGVLTSQLFSKRAAFGGAYGPILYLILCIPASFPHMGDIALFCVQDSLVILLTAWMSRRTQRLWSKRRRLVRA